MNTLSNGFSALNLDAGDDKEQVTAISEAMDEGEMILCTPFYFGCILSRNFKEFWVFL